MPGTRSRTLTAAARLHMLPDRYATEICSRRWPRILPDRARWIAGAAFPIFPETQEYVRKVTHTYFQPAPHSNPVRAQVPDRSIGSRRMTAG